MTQLNKKRINITFSKKKNKKFLSKKSLYKPKKKIKKKIQKKIK